MLATNMLAVPGSAISADLLITTGCQKPQLFNIKKVQAQVPAAKYLMVRRRHSLAPEAVIWEGKEESAANGDAGQSNNGDAKAAQRQPQQRRSCQFTQSAGGKGDHTYWDGDYGECLGNSD
jgi:hypothetical protein